jgi:hypothetical protein
MLAATKNKSLGGNMTLRKREFLAGLGVMGGLGLSQALAQGYPKGKDLGAEAPPPPHEIPHRKVTTKSLFKVPTGYPNGVAVVPEGVWVAEQTAQGYGKAVAHKPEYAWLFDWNGKKLKTVPTESYNTSGFAVGNGHLWMGANGGPEGIYEVDMTGKTVAHHQIPLGQPTNGSGCHGLLYRNGKLWIVANRLRGILRVDATTFAPEFLIPITAQRWHGIAWDETHPGGAIWMVTGTTETNRYVMQDGKLHHTTQCGLVKYDATTGAMLETAEFLDGTADAHGLDMHNGKLISCDAGVGPPGFEGTGSPSAGYVFEINFV